MISFVSVYTSLFFSAIHTSIESHLQTCPGQDVYCVHLKPSVGINFCMSRISVSFPTCQIINQNLCPPLSAQGTWKRIQSQAHALMISIWQMWLIVGVSSLLFSVNGEKLGEVGRRMSFFFIISSRFQKYSHLSHILIYNFSSSINIVYMHQQNSFLQFFCMFLFYCLVDTTVAVKCLSLNRDNCRLV